MHSAWKSKCGNTKVEPAKVQKHADLKVPFCVWPDCEVSSVD